MPPPAKDNARNRKIRDFFKPFTIPKSRIPVNDVVEEEIVLAPARGGTSDNVYKMAEPTTSASKGHSGGSLQPCTSPLSSAVSALSSSPIETTLPSEEKQTPVPQLDEAIPEKAFSSSQRRILTAVEVPSPKPADITTISFSSISSLTSVPFSTQSSSRRIIKNGMHAVTNSDSGSADSSSGSSSSDEELEDLSTFIPRKRHKLDSSLQKMDTLSATKPLVRQSPRLPGGSKRSSGFSTPRKEVTPPRKIYKHSLLNMARQREKEEETEIKIRQMEAEFEESERQRDEETNADEDGTRGKLAALADDSDEGERMNLAMQRTEAKGGEEDFFYFQGIRDDLTHPPLFAAPLGDSAHAWTKRLQDEKWRVQACLTGFVAAVVATHGLPHPLKDWLACQLIQEGREDLCEAYISIMEASNMSADVEGNAIPCFDDFYDVWRDPGAEAAKPGAWSPGSISRPPRGLSYVIRMLRHFSVQAGDHAIGPFVLQLMYAAIDDRVRSDASLKGLISDSIDYLLESAQDPQRVRGDVCKSFAYSGLSLQLKCRAITSLCACSEQTHTLRRLLALELICAHHLSESPANTRHADAILDRLRHAPEFQVLESTDYHQLNSLIAVLDLAIDVGFTGDPVHFHESVHAGSVKKKVSFLEDAAPANPLKAESAFDKQIDAFVLQLTLMSSRIKDAGTAHLHRIEAKHAIERLAKRLEYGVRTKPRPRKKTFGGVTGERQRTFLSSFMSRAGVKLAEHPLDEPSAGLETDEESDAVEGATEVVGNEGN